MQKLEHFFVFSNSTYISTPPPPPPPQHTQAPPSPPHPAWNRYNTILASGGEAATAGECSSPSNAQRNPHGGAGALLMIPMGVECHTDWRSNAQTRKTHCEWTLLHPDNSVHTHTVLLNTKQLIFFCAPRFYPPS